MNNEILATLIGVLGTLLVASAPPIIARARNRDLQLYKLSYVKVVHLGRMGEPPAYRVQVPRLGPHEPEIEVRDEVRLFRLNKFASRRREARSRDRSSGVVDLLILQPFKKLAFSDKGAEIVPGYLEQTIAGPTDTVFSMATYYNGLHEGHHDWAIQMEYRTREARLIVDFSSVPERDFLLKGKPTGWIRRGDEDENKGVVELRPGIYSLDACDLEEGDVLRLDFTLDRSGIDSRQLAQ